MIESNEPESTSGRPPLWVVLAPVIVMAIIFGFSSRSSLPNLDGGRGLQAIAGHFTVYAALGATLALLFRSLGWSMGRAFLAALVIAILYGVSDEFHQSFVPNRNVDAMDVLVDAIGATVGAAVMIGLLRAPSANSRSDADPTPPAAENSGRTPPAPPA